jgi:hypothetical protein
MPDQPHIEPGSRDGHPLGGASRPGGDHPDDAELRGHLDGSLAADVERRVADHLEVCDSCVARLDGFEAGPVLRLSSTAHDAPEWDERRARRSIRRTLLRTAVTAALLLVLGAIVLQLIGFYVLQPLLVDRGERVQRSVVATIDLPVMTNPGAEMRQVVSNPDIVRRTTEVEFERPVGARMIPLGWLTTRLGPVGMTTPFGPPSEATYGLLRDRDGSQVGPSDVSLLPFQPERLGSGTAVTVEMGFVPPIDRQDAQAVTAGRDDVALLWVGFAVPDTIGEPGAGSLRDPADAGHERPLGYSACGVIPEFLRNDAPRWGGFGGGGGFRTWEARDAGVEHALGELRRATANLAAIGWPDADWESSLQDLDATADALAAGDPRVTTLVVTGPLDAVAEVVEAADPASTLLLEVDFDRGEPEPCG